jgi:phosphoglucomutase
MLFTATLNLGPAAYAAPWAREQTALINIPLGRLHRAWLITLKRAYPGEKIKVAIAHDSRNNADLFSNITAEVFSANDIYVYFFEALRPTPELSFAIRTLGCKSGVMLTASHNPKEYNGYKAYGADGGQFVSPEDKAVMDEVAAIKSIDEIKFNRVEANIEIIGEKIDNLYLDKITELSVSKEAIRRQKDLENSLLAYTRNRDNFSAAGIKTLWF